MSSPATGLSDLFDNPAPWISSPEASEDAADLARQVLEVAREGGDVEAWLHAWTEDQVGRPLQ